MCMVIESRCSRSLTIHRHNIHIRLCTFTVFELSLCTAGGYSTIKP